MKTAETKFKDLLEQGFKEQGLDAATSKALSILYLEPEPISLNQLAKDSGYSLASMSAMLKFMEQMCLLKRIKKPGDKKVYMYMEKDIISLSTLAIEKKLNAQYGKTLDQVPELIKTFKAKAKTPEEKTKQKIIKEYYEQMKFTKNLLIKFKEGLDNYETNN